MAWVLWALCLELVMGLVVGWLLAAQLDFSGKSWLYIPTLKGIHVLVSQLNLAST